jgi:hypothetical protein
MALSIGNLNGGPVIVDTRYAVVAVNCTCGESTVVTFSGFNEADAFCGCGLAWQLRLLPTVVRNYIAPGDELSLRHTPSI